MAGLVGLLSPVAFASALVYCTPVAPDSFDSAQSDVATTHRAAAMPLYNRLVEYAPGSGQLIPGLAERWEISPDGLQYTFYLRRNVAFQHTPWFTPSRPFNADDVLWSLQRQIDPKHLGARAASSGFPGAISGNWAQLLRQITRSDPHIVRITLRQPYAPLLGLLASWQASIVSAEYGEQLARRGQAARMAVEPVGTGPYQLQQYTKNATIRYSANPQYFRGKSAIDQLIIAVVPDNTVRAQKLKNGECNLIEGLKPQDISLLENAPRAVLRQYTPQISTFVAFNTQSKPFNDERVRRALNIAIDRNNLIKAVFETRAQVGWWPYSRRILWGAPRSVTPPFDLAEARALLRAAGYPNGFQTTLWASTSGGNANLNPRLSAEMIQADWKRIGVHTTVVNIEGAEMLRRVRQGEHAAVLSGWQNSIDPDEFYANLLTCGAAQASSSRWCNRDFDVLLRRARELPDPAARTPLYVEAAQRVTQASPLAILAYPTATLAYSRGLEGVAPSPAAPFAFDQLRWAVRR